MRTLEEQNSLSRYASMTLQILSQKDEGKMAGEVTFLSEKECH